MEEGIAVWEVCWEVGKCHGPGAQGGLQHLECPGVSGEYWGLDILALEKQGNLTGA